MGNPESKLKQTNEREDLQNKNIQNSGSNRKYSYNSNTTLPSMNSSNMITTSTPRGNISRRFSHVVTMNNKSAPTKMKKSFVGKFLKSRRILNISNKLIEHILLNQINSANNSNMLFICNP